VLAGCVALLVVGTSGSVAALGDTLFPSLTLEDALRADLSATSHLLIRLRVLHPVLAVATALLLLAIAPRLGRTRGGRADRAARMVIWLTGGQLALGFLNVVLLAPVWLQIVHLLAADAIWIGFVLLGAEALAREAGAIVSGELSARGHGAAGTTGVAGTWPAAASAAREEMRQTP
jgi:heme A synthase